MNTGELAQTLSARFDCPVTLLQAGRYDRILFFGFRPQEKRPFLVCRLGRTEAGLHQLQEQALLRETLRAALPPDVREGIPWAHMVGETMIEPFMGGRPLQHQEGPLALEWLQRFQCATQEQKPGLLKKQTLRLLEWGQSLPLGNELSRLEHALAPLERLTPCAVHEDFWTGNLLREGKDLRVLDWEYLQALGNPCFDPLFFLLTSDAPMDWLLRFTPQPDWEACALTTILVLLTLVLRDGLEEDPTESRYYPVLQALLQTPDPVATAFAKWFLPLAVDSLEWADV